MKAALRSAGAGVRHRPRDEGGDRNAFCAVRPPGHHAERAKAMGFLLLQQRRHRRPPCARSPRLERVAVVDFDVHHGNGTEELPQRPAGHDGRIFQHPFYPYCGTENPCAHVQRAAAGGTRGDAFRQVFGDIVPALRSHSPQMIFISPDSTRTTRTTWARSGCSRPTTSGRPSRSSGVAESCGHKRIVSILEGGYSLSSRWRVGSGPHQDAGRSRVPPAGLQVVAGRRSPHTGHAGRVL